MRWATGEVQSQESMPKQSGVLDQLPRFDVILFLSTPFSRGFQFGHFDVYLRASKLKEVGALGSFLGPEDASAVSIRHCQLHKLLMEFSIPREWANHIIRREFEHFVWPDRRKDGIDGMDGHDRTGRQGTGPGQDRTRTQNKQERTPLSTRGL